MTHRQRMLAAIRGQPTDRIPWAPRMDLWMISLRARGLLPPEYQGMNMVEVSEALGVACHAVGGDFSLPGERDVRLRGLGIDNHPDYPYRVELHGLPMQSSDDGVDRRTSIETRSGQVYLHLHHSQQMARGRHLAALCQVVRHRLARRLRRGRRCVRTSGSTADAGSISGLRCPRRRAWHCRRPRPGGGVAHAPHPARADCHAELLLSLCRCARGSAPIGQAHGTLFRSLVGSAAGLRCRGHLLGRQL